jgi:hypothetical protein
MKITDEILLELGFAYNSVTEGFDLNIGENKFITIIGGNNEYWCYFNGTHPGSKVESIRSIMNLIYRMGRREGYVEKQNEIKQVLGL